MILRRILVAAGIALAGLAVVTPVAGASGYKMSQSAAASQFSGAGITWSSSGGCTNRYNSTCTSFDQINSGTVSTIITLKRASGCAINITGGTEVGHASGTYSHFNGYKVDISHNSCIDGYIHRTFSYIGYRGDGYPQWQAASGNLYCDEGSHWDILVY
ncbi:hypothetical protein F0L68_18595 [Solihabitans fulvus]|uniref:Uncharacterized protein n=1 Tax=Solihabitans fulvus TaxID=1892852 RepID=A0A5B2XDN8_9PSEU|nr:hypothetical protein [Solihabitans fulvus]KAA2261071.1 hypothetical protein F0L68_18595 [Solihabitans fulvus]